jgi:hypothetical protein
MRDALPAVLALAPAPYGFTVGDFAAKVHGITATSHAEHAFRQAALRPAQTFAAKRLIDKPGRARHYRVPALAARTIAALLTLCDQVIAPVLGIRSPPMGRKPNAWTSIDRDYEQLRVNMQTLFFDDLAPHNPGGASRIRTPTHMRPTSTTNCRSGVLERLEDIGSSSQRPFGIWLCWCGAATRW